MVRGDIEFISDTLLIQKLATMEYGIQKAAGFGDTLAGMLGEGFTTIKDKVVSGAAGILDTSSTESTVASVGNMIATGTLFKIWWPLGVINAVAAQMGLDIVSIGRQMWSKIKPMFDSGKEVSSADVSSVTKEVTQQIAGGSQKDASLFDPFELIRTAEREGRLFQLVKSGADIKGMFDWLGSINPFKAKSIIGGLVGWAIKSALIGASLLAVGGAAASLLGLKKKPTEQSISSNPTEEPKTPTSGAAYKADSAEENNQSSGLTPTGAGQDVHANNHSTSTWLVPMVGGSVSNTLLAWAGNVYKELRGQEEMISNLPSFNKTVNDMSKGLEYGSNQLTVPTKFKTRKQVVDQFASEAANKLANQQGQNEKQ